YTAYVKYPKFIMSQVQASLRLYSPEDQKYLNQLITILTSCKDKYIKNREIIQREDCPLLQKEKPGLYAEALRLGGHLLESQGNDDCKKAIGNAVGESICRQVVAGFKKYPPIDRTVQIRLAALHFLENWKNDAPFSGDQLKSFQLFLTHLQEE